MDEIYNILRGKYADDDAGTPPPIVCDICGETQLKPTFVFPVFDGPYNHGSKPGTRHILRCDNCGYARAFPFPHKRYREYYETLDEEYHQSHDQDSSRYRSIMDLLAPLTVTRVLDWGCGTGTFLSFFPSEVEKFGVEASRAAAHTANQNGIQTLSPWGEFPGELNGTFDVVTAIDVVEHISDPSSLRQSFVQLLKPGGTLILMTGDLESPSARSASSSWYYLHYAEHISFMCERVVRLWLEHEFEDIRITRTSHHGLSLKDKTYTSLVFATSWGLKRLTLGSFPRRPAIRFVDSDHMIVCARKR
jgi:2-polyprenyl-3-methyl-5-hydroxy-6-metoxy-1,4-benzoquinol methylase